MVEFLTGISVTLSRIFPVRTMVPPSVLISELSIVCWLFSLFLSSSKSANKESQPISA